MRRAQTAVPAPRKKRFGPGRSRLRQASGSRGRQLFNIWYHYSPRLERDVILRGDTEFDHFCWLEGDPRVRRYELEPSPVALVIDGQARLTQFDALVEFREGPPQLREVKPSDENLAPREVAQREAQTRAAALAGFEYVRITDTELAQHRQLIRNWRCALSFQASCREVFILPHCKELVGILNRERRCTLDKLLETTNPELRPVYLAALFRCLQEATFGSDLDTKPLSAATTIWLPEVAHG